MGYYRQPFIRWMTLTPNAFVARLGAAFYLRQGAAEQVVVSLAHHWKEAWRNCRCAG